MPVANPWEYSDSFYRSKLREIFANQVLIIFITIPKVSNQESLSHLLSLLDNNIFQLSLLSFNNNCQSLCHLLFHLFSIPCQLVL